MPVSISIAAGVCYGSEPVVAQDQDQDAAFELLKTVGAQRARSI